MARSTSSVISTSAPWSCRYTTHPEQQPQPGSRRTSNRTPDNSVPRAGTDVVSDTLDTDVGSLASLFDVPQAATRRITVNVAVEQIFCILRSRVIADDASGAVPGQTGRGPIPADCSCRLSAGDTRSMVPIAAEG